MRRRRGGRAEREEHGSKYALRAEGKWVKIGLIKGMGKAHGTLELVGKIGRERERGESYILSVCKSYKATHTHTHTRTHC